MTSPDPRLASTPEATRNATTISFIRVASIQTDSTRTQTEQIPTSEIHNVGKNKDSSASQSSTGDRKALATDTTAVRLPTSMIRATAKTTRVSKAHKANQDPSTGRTTKAASTMDVSSTSLIIEVGSGVASTTKDPKSFIKIRITATRVVLKDIIRVDHRKATRTISSTHTRSSTRTRSRSIHRALADLTTRSTYSVITETCRAAATVSATIRTMTEQT